MQFNYRRENHSGDAHYLAFGPHRFYFTFSVVFLDEWCSIETQEGASIPISSPEAAILLVCARNRDLWAKLKARQKDGQISLAVETCSFQPQSPTHAQNLTGSKISWFRFWIRPEPLRFTTAGQGDAGSGDEIASILTWLTESEVNEWLRGILFQLQFFIPIYRIFV